MWGNMELNEIKNKVEECRVNVFRQHLNECEEPDVVKYMLEDYLKEPNDEALEEIELEFSPMVIRTAASESSKLEDKLLSKYNKYIILTNTIKYITFFPLAIIAAYVASILGQLLIRFWEWTSTPFLYNLVEIPFFNTLFDIMSHITYTPLVIAGATAAFWTVVNIMLPKKYKDKIIIAVAILYTIFIFYWGFTNFENFWTVYSVLVAISFLWWGAIIISET